VCLSLLVQISRIDRSASTAVGACEGRTVPVSLAVLDLAGEMPEPGDWVLVTTGLATERLTPEEAAAVTEARTLFMEEAK